MIKIVKDKVIYYVLTLIFIAILFSIAAYTKRTNFILFITQYAVLFGIFWMVLAKNSSIKQILIVGLLARVTLLFISPELSNDFYRFIWDGELLLQGTNPYQYTPNELISYGAFLSNDYYLSLYHGMGELSQANYSCYPVLNQFFFAIAALFSDNLSINLVVLKLIIILGDLGVFFFGIKILKILGQAQNKIAWYFVNPFILLEFSGNLHFEGVMLCFILGFIYYILKNNWIIAGLFLGLAIHIKLIPLLFIPFVYKKLKWRNSVGFTAVVILVVLLFAGILLDAQNIGHFLSSLQLYFKSFQFNASVFAWVNLAYSEYIGWDTTQIVGPLLSKIAIGGILLLGLLKADKKPNDFIIAILFALTIYYVFATTVHPWYISLVLTFSMFTNYKFGVLWSALVMFSYLAYAHADFSENILLNSLLYLALFIYIGIEIKNNSSKKDIKIQWKDFMGISTKD
ncbi:hypothetical protein DNU06_05025 [Putridiphycobacter roseus]|uniref:Mannosyltransferase n=1 Tax=Putridiphycobacter roseus TaxID=2219161 RepID=A0A2W1N2C7_9FLAO|nr:glycosyltransferase family 87 protein [Putridiphycobacter roseus]PZE17984.1 hypothetical protein DNU06_05025 [Putridiphycobacter roseus]